jgi:hypothetical protein
VLAEIKSDKWIKENGNLLFENHRVNHFALNHWFYLGWGCRSPAQKLIIRNPKSYETFIFNFTKLRIFIAKYVFEKGKRIRIDIVPTDDQKTTFNLLIPFYDIDVEYIKCIIEP